MSEYQHYEFMTCDRPLTRAQLDAVNELSSHIDASATHALIEYHWGDFKHDPIKILREYFDAFLYWANWGSPRLAFRFPHGALPSTLIDDYDFDDMVIFTKHSDYDILDIHFGEMEAPDEWTEYELGSMIAIREELMEGDLRSLYIAWLAAQDMIGGDDDDEDDELANAPAVPPAFKKLTAAQESLTELLRVPEEILAAAGQHSQNGTPPKEDDFAAWIKLLSEEQRSAYLLRLAHNESGLSRLLVKELRSLGADKAKVPTSSGEHVNYATLLKESKTIKDKLQREKYEREQLARRRHLQEVHDQQEDYWQRVNEGAARGSSTGYKEAAQLLGELREASVQFQETQQFQARFSTWIQPHLRRPALLKHLRERNFIVPGV